MAIRDTYLRRQRRLRGEMPDVFTYDELPNQLRVQVIHIFEDSFRKDPMQLRTTACKRVRNILLRDLGVFDLTSTPLNLDQDLFGYFLQSDDIDEGLSWIEEMFDAITASSQYYENRGYEGGGNPIPVKEALQDLNERFREHGIGYQLESGQIIKVDSNLLHQEVMRPALALLREPKFNAAEKEFLNAHERYRNGRYEEAIVDALKSFESTLKVICKARNWTYEETDTASKLLKVAFDNELVPAHLQSEFSGLRTTLECGVPVVRNKQAGHGAGHKPRKLPEHLVSYVLHMTASAILFLAKSEEALK